MMRSTQNCFGAARVRQNTTTAINTITNNKLDGFIVPNPAQNKIELLLNTAFSKIEILDFKGCLVLQSKEKTIDISALHNGIYVAKVITENGGVFTSKFVKK